MNDNYKFLIETEWKDIHHSRIQEWSALGVITATHIGFVQLLNFIKTLVKDEITFQYLVITFCVLALLFCIIGMLMTCRHRRLMWIKLNWIFEAEEKLGLIKSPDNENGIIPADYKMVKSFHYKEEIEKENNREKKSNQPIWNKLMWPRFLSTSWLITSFYLLLAFIDIGFLIFALVIK